MGAVPLDEAFTDFVRESSASLSRTAWLLTGDREVAQDLVQIAYAKTLQAWGRIGVGGATAYTRRIIVNANIDRWRRRHGEIAVAEVTDTPTESFENRVADRDRITRMLADLPTNQRRVVVLRYYDDLSEQQVAAALDMSVGAVKQCAHRALTTLRAHYPQADAPATGHEQKGALR